MDSKLLFYTVATNTLTFVIVCDEFLHAFVTDLRRQSI